MTKTKQITYLTGITKKDMISVIEAGKRTVYIDPNFIPNPRIKAELLKALAPFRRQDD